MSDFWAKKLGQGNAPQAPASTPQQHAPASSRPWWDQSTPVQAQPVEAAPAGTQVLYDAQGNAVLVGPNGQVMATHRPDGDPSVEVHTKSARKAKAGGRCPECDSGNYTAINGQTKRCFDCGYPVVQAFSGMGGLAQGKAVGKTRQVEHGGTVNQFAVTTQAPSFAAEQGGPGR